MHILPYTEDSLAYALSNKYTSPAVIKSKNHFLYLKDYLGNDGLIAKSIVIEDNYISKDFLQDFASYYAFCFEPYPKVCKRVHFFDNDFSEEEFSKILPGNETDNKEFWQHYLGFIVIKPIPVTVIGYTVMKTYTGGHQFDMRNFWGIRDYTVHVFGNEIKLSSLAFQEQDSVLAACATTAVWSMLHKASIDLHTILKSPSQITKDADNIASDGSRLFPNKGLNILQICQAIFNSGLVSEVKQPDYLIKDNNGNIIDKVVSIHYLKKILNAYSSLGIPIILVIQVPSGDEFGLHAITVSGFKINAPQLKAPSSEISWLADNIEKFYAHDDQWGPFTRIGFNSEFEINSPWTVFDHKNRPTTVKRIVVPVYPKVRISYEDIEVIVLGLDRILTFFFENKIVTDLVWDIKIEFSENIKKQFKSSSIDEDEKLSRLTKSLPKYIWIASCYIGTNKIFDFTYDATDVSNGMISDDLICYLPSEMKTILVDFLKVNKGIFQSLFNHPASINYYEFLITKLS